MPDILDLGCGNKKRPGAIGIDVNPRCDADVIHDLNAFPYPFAESAFDEIYADNVIEQEPTMGAEDFAYMLQAKPGAYCFIANGDGSHREMGHGAGPCMLHNPSYDFNDDLIPLGATYWVRLAEQWLATARP